MTFSFKLYNHQSQNPSQAPPALPLSVSSVTWEPFHYLGCTAFYTFAVLYKPACLALEPSCKYVSFNFPFLLLHPRAVAFIPFQTNLPCSGFLSCLHWLVFQHFSQPAMGLLPSQLTVLLCLPINSDVSPAGSWQLTSLLPCSL